MRDLYLRILMSNQVVDVASLSPLLDLRRRLISEGNRILELKIENREYDRIIFLVARWIGIG